MFKVMLLSGLLFAGLGYYFYTPSPPGHKEPWKTSFHLSLLNVLAVPAIVLDKLGMDPINFDRQFWDLVFPLTHATGELDAQFITEDGEIEGVPVRFYRLKSQLGKKSATPSLVFFHGGGWVYCSYLVHDSTVKRMALDLGMSAIAMNYRLAPEHPFPTPLEDSLKVTKYYLNKADKFGVDREKVGFAGDSAGGHLASTVTLKLIAENFPYQPKVLALIYPDIQPYNVHTPSYQANKDGPFLTQLDMAFYWSSHAVGKPEYTADILENKHIPVAIYKSLVEKYTPLSALPNDDYVKAANYDKGDYPEYPEASEIWSELEEVLMNPFFSPLLAPDAMLQSFPPTYINACQYDVVRDDAIWFAKRVHDAIAARVVPAKSANQTATEKKMDTQKRTGLDDVLLDVHGCFHGWTLYTEDLIGAQEAMDRVTAFIRKYIPE